MAYQALYRKYRPASFNEVVGQNHIIQTLKNAIAKDRIAHAYLFCGPRGTGKTSIAKIFARTLNCTGDHPPCMHCENCRLSLAGTHPDIIEIDAASNNGVEEVRSLIDRVGYSPLEGKYKVYIIDEVHMMTSGAFNALLKTIEEPPAHVIFIFATTEPHKVLPTILSRCQRYDFSKVSTADICSRLLQVCEKEGIQADSEAISLVAELADGGMRDALSILDQCIAYEQDHLTIDAVREIYGVVRPEEIGSLLAHLNPDQAGGAIQELVAIQSRGADMKRFTADLIGLLKDSLLLEITEQTSLLSDSRKEILKTSFLGYPRAQRLALLNDLLNFYSRLAYSSNLLDYLETFLLKFALWQPVSNMSNSYEKQKSGLPPSDQKYETQVKPISKPPKTLKPEEKSKIGELFWTFPVSRETAEINPKSKSEFLFSEDFLLGLLVGATKEEKSQDQSRFAQLTEYRHDLAYARFASPLRDALIAASGPTYIVVAVKNSMMKDHINELQKNQGFEGFMQLLLDKPKKVFALSMGEMQQLIQTFKARAAAKTLPPAVTVTIEKEAVKPEISVEDQLKKRFVNLKIVND